MDRHAENAMKLAEYILSHTKVEKVNYPGLASHQQFQVANKKMSGWGGMLSFEVKGGIEAGQRLMDKLRKELDGLVMRSSFIVGFPGETEEQFRSLVEFVRQYQFDKIAVFPYSKEENTLAAKYGGEIPEKTAFERYDRLTEVKKEVAMVKNQNFLNMATDVLVEACYKAKGGYEMFWEETRGTYEDQIKDGIQQKPIRKVA